MENLITFTVFGNFIKLYYISKMGKEVSFTINVIHNTLEDNTNVTAFPICLHPKYSTGNE